MGVNSIEHIQNLQRYGFVSPEWASKAMKKAVDFEAQMQDIAINAEVGFNQVREDVEKYARENPVTLVQAASVIEGRLLRR